MNAAKIPLLVSAVAGDLGPALSRVFLVFSLALLACCISFSARAAQGGSEFALPGEGEGDVEIVIGEDKTVYEYRANGVLMIIKVVPENGRPYYMVPADGSPHYTDLDHSNSLYPQWILLQW